MNPHFTTTNHFTDIGLEFPSVTFCGAVFNDILQKGLSLNQFEEKYKRLAKSKIDIQTTWKTSVQYNLQTDIWGPKEILLIFKEGQDYDAGIAYGIRNDREFATVDKFLKGDSSVELVQEKVGNRMFNVKIPAYAYLRTREMLIYLVRETEQTAKVTMLLNF
jgi:hypothetical protein